MRGFFTWRAFGTADGWEAAPASVADGAPVMQYTGPVAEAAAPFVQAVPSWCAHTPPGSWIELQVRARMGARWTNFYRVARWDAAPENSARTSLEGQRDAEGRVATDTLVLNTPAAALQVRVLLHAGAAGAPTLERIAVALSAPDDAATSDLALPTLELAVPPRAQLDYADGPNICSPTSVSMVLAYWQARTGDAALAPFAERRAVEAIVTPQVYDPAYEGHGNWAFNTAFAAAQGLDAAVRRFGGLAELVPWLAAGVPIIISVAWQPGTLDNAPIPRSAGHLLVVAGFTTGGRVLVADPRGDTEAEVRREYDAAQLEYAWQSASQGTAYVIHPRGWPVPE